jgi:hypothetical protein
VNTHPLVSVLLPSRGRPESLLATIAGLHGLATDPDRVEVLVACDPDDTATYEAAWEADNTATVLTADERYGYHRLQEYVNRLAAQATGRWLMLWNDDATMLTEGWDKVIADQPAAPSGLAVLHPGSNQGPVLNTFPIFTRGLYELLGHVSISPHCDSYLEAISRPTGIEHRVPIEVRHDRYDLTGLHNDATFADAQAGYRTSDFHSAEVQDQITADIAKIRAAHGG